MFRFTPTVLSMAALLAMFVTAEVVEAAKPRSPVERRQRPGSGFWDKSSSQSRSYSSNRSMFQSIPMQYQTPRQYAVPQRYAAPRQVAPRRYYATPQRRIVPQNVVRQNVVPQQNVVRQNVVPQQSVVREQRDAPRSNPVTAPVRTESQSMTSQPVRSQRVPVR